MPDHQLTLRCLLTSAPTDCTVCAVPAPVSAGYLGPNFKQHLTLIYVDLLQLLAQICYSRPALASSTIATNDRCAHRRNSTSDGGNSKTRLETQLHVKRSDNGGRREQSRANLSVEGKQSTTDTRATLSTGFVVFIEIVYSLSIVE